MSMETKPPAGAPDKGPGYERRDAEIAPLLKAGIWLVAVLIAALVSMYYTFKVYDKMQPVGPMVSPLVRSDETVPPKPQLQAHPRVELQDYCSAENEKLTTYGWVDRHAGVVRLPIDRAMVLTLQNGLPTRPADQTSAAAKESELPADITAVPPTRDFQGQCGYVVQQLEAEKPKEGAKE